MILCSAFCLVQSAVDSKIEFKSGLGISVPGNGRVAFRLDPVEKEIISKATLFPTVGDSIGTRKWVAVQPGQNGAFTGAAARGGYIQVVVSSEAKTMNLVARGHGMVYVNGEPRGGDVYDFGWVKTPVRLQAGKNEFLFAGGRGNVRASLEPTTAGIEIDGNDATLPSNQGNGEPIEIGVVVRNTTMEWIPAAKLSVQALGAPADSEPPLVQVIRPLPPLSVQKIPLKAHIQPGTTELRVENQSAAFGKSSATFKIGKADRTGQATFRSAIDDSVQYFAYVRPERSEKQPNAIILSLHGASVEASGQAGAYGSNALGPIICPTNRRPYGFDWEDIGRKDAMEVLAYVQQRLNMDPTTTQTYLTGHSMGGHGTWQLGVHYPDRFAAIAPSAGWASFWSYTGGFTGKPGSEIDAFLRRASNSSDTVALKNNLKNKPVFVLHGDADDNVPVSEARNMRKILEELHSPYSWYEEKGAGHWWSKGLSKGSDCVDWPGIWELFGRSRLPQPDDRSTIDFTTMSPAINRQSGWVKVEAQERQMLPSRIQAQRFILRDKGFDRAEITLTTENVDTLSIQLQHSTPTATFTIDGRKLEMKIDSEPAGGSWLTFAKEKGTWSFAGSRSVSSRVRRPSMGLKDVFDRRVVFVVGTQGDAKLTNWALSKAKFDSETYWYRGNASPLILTDKEYLSLGNFDRNVVLYGTPETNKAWDRLVDSNRIKVLAGAVILGEQRLEGPELAVLATMPSKANQDALVMVVSGTSLVGCRLTERSPYFVSGAGFPDVMVWDPSTLINGTSGIRLLGYFGNDWSAEKGEWVWNK